MRELLPAPRVIVVNGGSSSGKSTLTSVLQTTLPGDWLRLGVDVLVEACPPSLLSRQGLDLAENGSVSVGEAFSRVESFWMAGVARMAELGALVLVEDNFVSGPVAQQRWRQALKDIPTGWVGVRCAAATAASRERHRGDRIAGMAGRQADAVHVGIHYDLEVDTGRSTPTQLGERVRDHWFGVGASEAGGTR